MIQLRRDKEYSEKYYENRKKTTLCINHIIRYIGEKKIEEGFCREFEQYKQRVMVTYLFSDINGVSLLTLEDDLVTQFGFQNRSHLMKFIKENTDNGSDVNKTIKRFGFRIAYLIHRIRKVLK
jgi:hypothetical protein